MRLTVLADGTVGQAVITRRAVASYSDTDSKLSALGRNDLDAEVLRMMRSVHFEPSKAESDTITVVSVALLFNSARCKQLV